MKRRFRLAAMLLPIVALSSNIVSGSSDSTMFRGNVQRSGVYDAPGVPELHGVRWKFNTGGRVYSSPAVVGGVAYVGNTDGNLYAIDAATGAEKWAADNKGSWVIGSPAVKDGKLIRSSLPH